MDIMKFNDDKIINVFLHPICSTENVKGEEPINNPKEKNLIFL